MTDPTTTIVSEAVQDRIPQELLDMWSEVDRIMSELDRKEYVEGEMASALPDTPRRRFKRKPTQPQNRARTCTFPR